MEKDQRIVRSDLTEVEKLAQSFRSITDRYVEHAEAQVELARAMKDQEALVKEHIKLGVMNHARSIFQDCFRSITGRMAWDE
jgi:hypothetical protein